MTVQTPSPIFANYTVTRYAAGSYVSGRWVDGSTSTLTIRASVQPATSDQLRRLPEALRTRAAMGVITTTEVRTADEATGTPADTISIDGEDWEIQQVDAFGVAYAPALQHWEAVAMRSDRGRS